MGLVKAYSEVLAAQIKLYEHFKELSRLNEGAKSNSSNRVVVYNKQLREYRLNVQEILETLQVSRLELEKLINKGGDE